MLIEKVPLKAIKGAWCVWGGCEETFELKGDDIPPGWRYLVVASGSLLEIMNLMNADRDAMLCPLHVRQLNSLLKALS